MERPIITVSEGKIQGTTLKSVLGVNYLGFRGIPYAQPPLSDLRFREPQPPLKWTGIRDASKFMGDIVATQKETVGQPPFGVIGGEDCLYLNVYTNSMGQKKPVMVYIHGGTFIEGNGNILYGEDYFVTFDLIIVFINYRLGPLGFLNLGHKVAPGNQGLRDVILALKWIQTNIEAFGGNPNNVTIFGHSAGSMICHLLTILPDSKNLFQKAIMQSGTMYLSNNFITGIDFKNGYKIASLLGMDSDDPVKVIEFLRSVPVEKLVALEGCVLPIMERGSLKMEYEPNFDAPYTKDPVFPLPFKELCKNNAAIPIMIGDTSEEGLLFLLGKLNCEETFALFDSVIELILVNTYHLNLEDSSKFAEIIKFTREYHFKNEPVTKDNVWNLIRFLTDILINHNRKIIDLRNEYAKAPTYVYHFTYLGDEPDFFSFDQGPQPLKGVAHAHELSYMFYIAYMKKDRAENDKCPKKGSQDWLTMKRLTKMWYNFAATGNPTPDQDELYAQIKWIPTSKKSLIYLEIGEELALKNDETSESRKYFAKINDFF